MPYALIVAFLGLVGSVAAIVISIKAWSKNRAIYDIETTPLRGDTIVSVRKKLASGEYSIISAYHEGQFPNDQTQIILGRIKKNK